MKRFGRMGAFDGLRGGQVSSGYWGEHTSTIDWCELNYTHTPLIAEFYNTLTNLPSILMGLYGFYQTLAHGIQLRYALAYLGVTLIGIGSFGFHASLRWEWQLMDELPMIYVVSYAAYLVMDTKPSFEPRYGIWGPFFVVAWCSFVTFSYVCLPNPVYHQVAFALILLSSVGRNLYLISRLPAKHSSRQKITRTMVTGIATFALGFAIWNVDNVFCSLLRDWRVPLGMWGFLLQGHGYWHLMTGYGSYLILSAAMYLQLAIKVSPDAYTYNSASWFPVVTKVNPEAAKSQARPALPAELADGDRRSPVGETKPTGMTASRPGKLAD